MQSNTSKIIIAVIITAIIVGGGVYYWQQKPATEKQSGQSIKTSEELMKELILKNNPSAAVENYKIFAEIKNTNSTKSAVLFGLDLEKTKECCSKPTGIFINNQGSLGTKYDILQGSLEHTYLENAKWQDNKIVQYDFVVSDEGGEKTTQKSIVTD